MSYHNADMSEQLREKIFEIALWALKSLENDFFAMEVDKTNRFSYILSEQFENKISKNGKELFVSEFKEEFAYFSIVSKLGDKSVRAKSTSKTFPSWKRKLRGPE